MLELVEMGDRGGGMFGRVVLLRVLGPNRTCGSLMMLAI